MDRKHCCHTMTYHANYTCEQHPDPFDCPDHLIWYSRQFDEHGIIIHDGGASVIVISFCPWCGKKLASKRDLWYETLAELGFDDPAEQEIPTEFKSDQWYHK